MKNKITPQNNEILVPEESILVSKTNDKGIIKYCNHDFIEISGFAEEELLGQQHNIVRHPDMPRCIFDLLWQTIKAHREFNGYIKNLTKNGGYYWVLANVTPSFGTNNELLGFYSVRRKPNPEKIDYIKNLYLQLLEAENESAPQDAIAASKRVLDGVLNNKEMGYDEFVFNI